jgi:hypothetical protein
MRKPPQQAVVADLEAFVSGEAPASSSRRLNGRPGKQPQKRINPKPAQIGASDVWRPNAEDGKGGLGVLYRRVTIYLLPEVARAFHSKCVAGGTTMSAKIEKWVAEYLSD